MMRYEHRTDYQFHEVSHAAEFVQSGLEEAQADGWECVSVAPVDVNGTTHGFVVVMKRPVA
jgi:hypothetical protein